MTTLRNLLPILLAVAALPPAARAEEEAEEEAEAPIEEMFLGESAWTQEASAIQLTLAPGWARGSELDMWSLGGVVEYGITDHWQLAVEAERTAAEPTMSVSGDDDEAATEVAAGVLYGFAPGGPFRAALGCELASEMAAGETSWAVEPVASLAVGNGRWFGNLTASSEVEPEEGEASARGAAAAFLVLGRWLPLAEVAVEHAEETTTTTGSAGLALHLADVEIAVAGGARSGPEAERTVRAQITWEIDLADRAE